MATIEEAQSLAVAHFHAGQYQQAEALCRQVLQAGPSNADCLHLLGIIVLRQGDAGRAIGYFQQAISLQPSKALFHANLGAALATMGKFDQAIPCLARALQLDPNSPEALTALASARSLAGQFEQAEAHCELALRHAPESAEAWNIRGNIARLQGKWELAVEYFRQAVKFDPRHSTAQNNLAASLHTLGRKREAMAGYRQALALSPDYAGAHNNLAALLQEEGELDEAEAHLREAVRLQPGLPDAHNNLGGVLQLQARLDEAIACFRTAEALAGPDATPNGNLLLCINYHPRYDSAMLLTEHRRWGQRVETAVRPMPARIRNPKRRLRIGYVSPDLCKHATTCFVEPILSHHNPENVEVFCYAEVPAPDKTTEQMKKSASGWRSTVGMPDSAVAEMIRADEIDILVDLGGHTARSRITVFARKPAPVQVTYLGYPNTIGLKAIDFRLTDSIADPTGETPAHTEELFRLPRAFCCYAPCDSDPPVAPLPAGRTGVVTFGSMHTLARLNRGVLDTWCKVLQAVPSSRLLVFRHMLRGKMRDELLRYLTSQGIAAGRIDLQSKVNGPGGYASVNHHFDILLDTFPWSGHTTACQSLWMGVPTITLRGDRFAGRMVASVLNHVGLPHLVANTREQYVQLAAKLASDIPALSRLRATLRQQMSASTLCDAVGFTQDLEMSYRQMWERQAR